MSETELVSTSLLYIGAEEITSLDADTSKRARIARRIYPRLRDRLLSQYRWNFALRRTLLEGVASPAPTWGFERAYALPADILVLWDTSFDRREPYRVENGQLLTNEPGDVGADNAIGILYTPRITETSMFTEGFRTCLELILAAHLAVPVVNNAELRNSYLDEFAATLQDVLPRESQEEQTPVIFADDLHIVRFTRSTDIFDVDVDPSAIPQSPFE